MKPERKVSRSGEAVLACPLMPGAWTLGTRGQAGPRHKSRAPGRESQIRVPLIKADSPEEPVLQEVSVDTPPGWPQHWEELEASLSAVAHALLWMWSP